MCVRRTWSPGVLSVRRLPVRTIRRFHLKTAEILDLGAQLDIVKKRGAFYSYQDLKLGQGRDKSIDFLNVNLELRDEIEEKIREFAKDSDTAILQFSSEENEDVEYERIGESPSDLDIDDDDDEDEEF